MNIAKEDFGPLRSGDVNDSPTRYVALDKSLNIFGLFSHLENEGTRLSNRACLFHVLGSLFMIPQGSGAVYY